MTKSPGGFVALHGLPECVVGGEGCIRRAFAELGVRQAFPDDAGVVVLIVFAL